MNNMFSVQDRQNILDYIESAAELWRTLIKLTEDGVIKYVGTSRKRYWELLKK